MSYCRRSREYSLYETSPKASGLEICEIGLVSSPYDALDEGSELLYSTVFDVISKRTDQTLPLHSQCEL